MPYNKKLTMTVNEAVEYTGIGRNTFRKLIEWGKIPVLKIGTKILVRPETLDIFIKKNEGRNLAKQYEVVAV